MPPRRRNRVVTKARYATYLANKTALRAAGTVLLVVSMLAAVMSARYFLLTGLAMSMGLWGPGIGRSFNLAILSFSTGVLGTTLHICASAIRPVVPLTRHTVMQMEPDETLVRGSSPPPESVNATLLRGAPSGTQPDLLLRAETSDAPPSP